MSCRTVIAQVSEHAAEHLEGRYKDSGCKMPGIKNKAGRPTPITPDMEWRLGRICMKEGLCRKNKV